MRRGPGRTFGTRGKVSGPLARVLMCPARIGGARVARLGPAPRRNTTTRPRLRAVRGCRRRRARPAASFASTSSSPAERRDDDALGLTFGASRALGAAAVLGCAVAGGEVDGVGDAAVANGRRCRKLRSNGCRVGRAPRGEGERQPRRRPSRSTRRPKGQAQKGGTTSVSARAGAGGGAHCGPQRAVSEGPERGRAEAVLIVSGCRGRTGLTSPGRDGGGMLGASARRSSGGHAPIAARPVNFCVSGRQSTPAAECRRETVRSAGHDDGYSRGEEPSEDERAHRAIPRPRRSRSERPPGVPGPPPDVAVAVAVKASIAAGPSKNSQVISMSGPPSPASKESAKARTMSVWVPATSGVSLPRPRPRG